MAMYSKEDYERIAKAIGKSLAEIVRYENEFEEAATWYRLNIPPTEREGPSTSELRKRHPKRPKTLSKQRSKKPNTHSELLRKAKRIEAAARKLLWHLGVYHCRDAPDGPGDRDLLVFLATYSRAPEEEVTQATARIGRLAELLGAINAAEFFEVGANKAAQEAIHFDKLLPKGHHGDIVRLMGVSIRTVRRWIAEETISSVKLGGARLVAKAELRRVLSGPSTAIDDVAENGHE